jgi:hypothetical protein
MAKSVQGTDVQQQSFPAGKVAKAPKRQNPQPSLPAVSTGNKKPNNGNTGRGR